jgi:hypothetical protein
MTLFRRRRAPQPPRPIIHITGLGEYDLAESPQWRYVTTLEGRVVDSGHRFKSRDSAVKAANRRIAQGFTTFDEWSIA